MRRMTGLIGAAIVVLAACGSGDGAAPTTTAVSTTAVSTTAPTTTTSVAAPGPGALLAGTYAGVWENATFRSSGSVEVAISFAGKQVTIAFDLGGNVFGLADPDPATVVIDAGAGSPYTFTTDLLGETTLAIDDIGTVEITATDIPAPGIASLVVFGVMSPEGGEFEYTIDFEDGRSAMGTMSITRA